MHLLGKCLETNKFKKIQTSVSLFVWMLRNLTITPYFYSSSACHHRSCFLMFHLFLLLVFFSSFFSFFSFLSYFSFSSFFCPSSSIALLFFLLSPRPLWGVWGTWPRDADNRDLIDTQPAVPSYVLREYYNLKSIIHYSCYIQTMWHPRLLAKPLC